MLSSRSLYRGRVINLRVDEVETSLGRQITREVVEHDGCVVIMALDDERQVLLVRQFRYPAGQSLLEVPAGGLNVGEAEEEGARRELREETGYLPRQLKRLGGFFACPGYSTEYQHLYLAQDLEHRPLVAEDTEDIELVRVELTQVPRLIASGEIQDAKSIAGLFMALRHLGL